jgi:hypothetical protein
MEVPDTHPRHAGASAPVKTIATHLTPCIKSRIFGVGLSGLFVISSPAYEIMSAIPNPRFAIDFEVDPDSHVISRDLEEWGGAEEHGPEFLSAILKAQFVSYNEFQILPELADGLNSIQRYFHQSFPDRHLEWVSLLNGVCLPCMLGTQVRDPDYHPSIEEYANSFTLLPVKYMEEHPTTEILRASYERMMGLPVMGGVRGKVWRAVMNFLRLGCLPPDITSRYWTFIVQGKFNVGTTTQITVRQCDFTNQAIISAPLRPMTNEELQSAPKYEDDGRPLKIVDIDPCLVDQDILTMPFIVTQRQMEKLDQSSIMSIYIDSRIKHIPRRIHDYFVPTPLLYFDTDGHIERLISSFP